MKHTTWELENTLERQNKRKKSTNIIKPRITNHNGFPQNQNRDLMILLFAISADCDKTKEKDITLVLQLWWLCIVDFRIISIFFLLLVYVFNGRSYLQMKL